MAWYAYLAYFVAGIFLANGVPHFVHGISGERFQSPFARPPGVGESSPIVNVVWGTVNFAIGYILIFKIDRFEFGFTTSALMVAVGAFVTAVVLALTFGRVRSR